MNISFSLSSSSSTTLEHEKTLNQSLNEPDDHERFSHYVKKDKITESLITGIPVIALCGKVWLPGRNPYKFPICPKCKEIYETFIP